MTEQPETKIEKITHIYIATDGGCSANGKANAKATYGFVALEDMSYVPKIKSQIMSSNMYKTVIKTIIDKELKSQDSYFAQNGLVPEENNIKPSNNRGELCGIKYAIDHILRLLKLNDNQRKYSFTIVSDSAYSIGAVNDWGAKWLKKPEDHEDKKNTDIVFPLVAAVTEIRKQAILTFKHVRSHRKFDSSLSELDMFLWILNFQVDSICSELL